MGMQLRPQIWHVGAIGRDIANNKVTRPLQDGQDQVSVPQVPLLGHGDAIETLNLGCRNNIPDQCLSKKYLCSCHVSRLWGMSRIS